MRPNNLQYKVPQTLPGPAFTSMPASVSVVTALIMASAPASALVSATVSGIASIPTQVSATQASKGLLQMMNMVQHQIVQLPFVFM